MRSRLYSAISVPFFAILYFHTAIIVFILLILAWLKMKKPIKAISQFWAKSVFFLMGKKFEVVGKEKIKNNGKYILVANHASLFDIVAIVSFYPGVSWFGHERLLKIPLFGNILRMTDYVSFKETHER
jgi:1-acyl-sn-glycerol-3-phosphate acyltransferase